MAIFVLLSRSAENSASDLKQVLSEAGIAVLDHVLGSTPSVEFGSIHAAVIEVGAKPDAAVSQTRRWRAELGDELLPIVWLIPGTYAELASRGLEAGADVVLSDPVDRQTLIAQIHAATRVRFAGLRVEARASEARLLGEQLQKAYAQIDRDLNAAQRLHQAFLPQTLPELDLARFAVHHCARSRMSTDFYDFRVLDDRHVGLFLGDVIGCGTASSLTGVFLTQSVGFATRAGSDSSLLSPGEVLSILNRKLLSLGLEERPLVAMATAIVDAQSGELMLARAGLPAPVFLPANGEAQIWTIPGPFLGTADAHYQTHQATLKPGDKLVLGTDGTRPDGDPSPGENIVLVEAAGCHRDRSGQDFIDAVARDLVAQIRHSDDFTLLSVEMS